MSVVLAHVGLLAISYWIWGICHFADDVAEFLWCKSVKTLTVGYNANTSHLYCGRREQYALLLGSKKALWAGFAAEEYYCVEFRR